MSRSRKPAPAAAPRVVFDTAVLLRALLLPGDRAGALRRAWQEGRCQALIDAASAGALMTALAAPALKLAAAERQELLADFLPYAEVVTEVAAAGVARRDPGLNLAALDRLALGLAQAGGASLLVSDSAALHAWLGAGQRGTRRSAAHTRIEALESAEFCARL
jgi:predicted nucleic acid-binding protein